MTKCQKKFGCDGVISVMYLHVIRGVDDGVGRVMAYLERENLIDNTIANYAVDHGYFWERKDGSTNGGSMKSPCACL